MWDFADHPRLAQIAAAIYERQGVVAAVCHGPSGLVNLKLSNGEYLVKGKRIAAFTNAEERAGGQDKIVPYLLQSKLEERGAKVVAAASWTPNVQTDQRVVTGQNPTSAGGVGAELVKLLQKQRVNNARL